MKKTLERYLNKSVIEATCMKIQSDMDDKEDNQYSCEALHKRMNNKMLHKLSLYGLVVLLVTGAIFGSSITIYSFSTPEYKRELYEKRDELIENGSIELISLREEYIKHFAFSDGSFGVTIYPFPVHYKNANGNWEDLFDWSDSSIVEQLADYENVQNGQTLESLGFCDTVIDYNNPNKNNVNEELLPVEGDNIMLNYFKLPTLPDGMHIEHAQLIYWYTTEPTEDPGMIKMRLYSIDDEWNPADITADSFDVASLGKMYSDGYVVVSEASLYGVYGTCRFIITDLVNDWYSGKPNYGVGIKRDEELCSSEVVTYFNSKGKMPGVYIFYKYDD